MYQALYRKWRPKTFDEVAGQEHITVTLKTQVRTGRLSHAYLFTGARGTGKTSCARILARAVNCENPVDGNPCNTCRACRGIEDGSILDVVEIDAASNSSVDNVRQLRDEAAFSPAETRKRVYIIDEVHMLSASAFNALLKILEEPPEHLMFILATTELHKVLPTILSRCQRYAFKRIDTETLVSRLNYVAEQESLDLTPEAAALIAGLSEGGLRDALSMLDQCAGRERIDTETVYAALGLAGRLETSGLLRQLGTHDTGGALETFHRLWHNGKNPASVLGELSDLLRDLLLLSIAPRGGVELLSGGFDAETLHSFDGLFSREALVAAMDTLQTAMRDMRNGQAKTVCELCLISLSEPGLNDGLPALRQRIAELEHRLSSGAPQPPPPLPQAAPMPATPLRAAPPAAPAAENVAPPPPASVDSHPPIVARAAPDEPAAQDAPAASGEPADGEALWQAILARAPEVLTGSLPTMLSDVTQVSHSFQGDHLNIGLGSPFFVNILDRPDVVQQISALAETLAGRPITVKFVDGPVSAPTQGTTPGDAMEKLEALRKFPVVRFK